MKYEQLILVALGANLPSMVGTPAATLRACLECFPHENMDLLSVSQFYDTPCFPPGAGPDYVNAAVTIRPGPTPQEVLERLHRIEARFGRVRFARAREARWGMRTLDLDLLAAGDTVLPDAATQDAWRNLAPGDQTRRAPDQLILPHPRLQDRAFVLVPLADVAPGWRHPALGLTVTEMLTRLPQAERDAVRPRAAS